MVRAPLVSPVWSHSTRFVIPSELNVKTKRKDYKLIEWKVDESGLGTIRRLVQLNKARPLSSCQPIDMGSTAQWVVVVTHLSMSLIRTLQLTDLGRARIIDSTISSSQSE